MTFLVVSSEEKTYFLAKQLVISSALLEAVKGKKRYLCRGAKNIFIVLAFCIRYFK